MKNKGFTPLEILKSKNRHRENKSLTGFTLLEVMVAIFILNLGVAGALPLIQKTLAFTSLTVSRVVAAHLLQEGIEIVRNIRDGNWLEGEAWDEGIKAGNWEVDYKTKVLNQTYLDPGRYLNIDNDGFYSYSAGTPTKFKRKITIFDKTDLNSPPDGIIDTFKVSVTVYWEERGQTYSLSGQENLYNWFYP